MLSILLSMPLLSESSDANDIGESGCDARLIAVVVWLLSSSSEDHDGAGEVALSIDSVSVSASAMATKRVAYLARYALSSASSASNDDWLFCARTYCDSSALFSKSRLPAVASRYSSLAR